MTAAEVIDRLRARHPADALMGRRRIPGPWTVLAEFHGIDLLAIAANKTPRRSGGRFQSYSSLTPYPWIGYEIKVSRADLRQELLRPEKRAHAMAITNEFFFAVPKGLLKPEELAVEEPEWVNDSASRLRTPCDAEGCHGSVFVGEHRRRRRYHLIGKVWDRDRGDYRRCTRCKGKGYLKASRIERELPTLWIPRDVGLIEVSDRCLVTRDAPLSQREELSPEEIGTLVRWVSVRPDPRHSRFWNGNGIPAATRLAPERTEIPIAP